MFFNLGFVTLSDTFHAAYENFHELIVKQCLCFTDIVHLHAQEQNLPVALNANNNVVQEILLLDHFQHLESVIGSQYYLIEDSTTSASIPHPSPCPISVFAK